MVRSPAEPLAQRAFHPTARSDRPFAFGNATLDRNNVNCEPARGCRALVHGCYALWIVAVHDQSVTCVGDWLALTAGVDESRICYGESYVESTCCWHHLADDRRQRCGAWPTPRSRCTRASTRRRSAVSAWLSASPHIGTRQGLTRTTEALTNTRAERSLAISPRDSLRAGWSAPRQPAGCRGILRNFPRPKGWSSNTPRRRAATSTGRTSGFLSPQPVVMPATEVLDQLAALLNGERRVTLLCGSGCQGAHDQLMALAARLKAPIVHALKGKEHIEWDNPYNLA